MKAYNKKANNRKKRWLMLFLGLIMLGLSACDAETAVNDSVPMFLLTKVEKYGAEGKVESSKVMSYQSDGTLADISWKNENDEITRTLQYGYYASGELKFTNDIVAGESQSVIEYIYDDWGRNVSVNHWQGGGDERYLAGETTTVYEDGAKYQDSVWYDDSGAVSYMVHIVYDEQDNQRSAVNTKADGMVQSRTEWAYDEAGREVAYRQYDGEGILVYNYDTVYDEQGNKVSVSGGWVDENGRRETQYEYDAAGNLVREIIKYANGGKVFEHLDYTYDETGKKVGQIYYIGGLEDGAWAEEYRYVYDEAGNLAKLESVDENGRVYAWREYEYVQVNVPTGQQSTVKEQQGGLL